MAKLLVAATEAEVAADVKQKALIYLCLVVAVTLLIGLGLPRLELQPGMPLPSVESGQVVAAPGDARPVGMPVGSFAKILLFIIIGVLLAITLYRAIKGVNWKELLKRSLSLFFALTLVFGVLLLIVLMLPRGQAAVEVMPLPTPQPLARGPLGPVPPLLIWLVALGLLAAAVALGFWVLRPPGPPARQPWELEIEQAHAALLAGEDLRDVILQCYQRMSSALQEERAIAREMFMTAAEFERVLAAKGAPQAPVHQLTQLFEAVRYGRWQPAAADEQAALGCLAAMLEFSHTAGQES